MNFAPLLAAGPAIHIHLGVTLAALVLGAVMLLRTKGTQLHRRLGWIWVILMLIAAISSFWITGSDGAYSLIHGLSAIILLTVPAAVLAIRRRKVSIHRRAMIAIYCTGLVLPGLFTLLPHRLLGAALLALAQ